MHWLSKLSTNLTVHRRRCWRRHCHHLRCRRRRRHRRRSRRRHQRNRRLLHIYNNLLLLLMFEGKRVDHLTGEEKHIVPRRFPYGFSSLHRALPRVSFSETTHHRTARTSVSVG